MPIDRSFTNRRIRSLLLDSLNVLDICHGTGLDFESPITHGVKIVRSDCACVLYLMALVLNAIDFKFYVKSPLAQKWRVPVWRSPFVKSFSTSVPPWFSMHSRRHVHSLCLCSPPHGDLEGSIQLDIGQLEGKVCRPDARPCSRWCMQ